MESQLWGQYIYLIHYYIVEIIDHIVRLTDLQPVSLLCHLERLTACYCWVLLLDLKVYWKRNLH